ncbi:peptide deformylase [bacterium]|nr:peptide deformylase [bacterium]
MKIITYPNPILRKRTKKVTDFSKIEKIVKEMKEIMEKHQGIGLSANQVGLDLSLFVAKYNQKFYVVINPEILKVSKERKEMLEGCLSLPKILANVKRPKSVVLEALNEKGKKIKLKAKGLLARVFLHETDHLNGILMIDKTNEIYQLKKEIKDLV